MLKTHYKHGVLSTSICHFEVEYDICVVLGIGIKTDIRNKK